MATLTDYQADLEQDPLRWVATLFPQYAQEPFGDHHAQLFDWLWGIRTGVRPRPFFAIWSRGFAKSTSAEIGVTALGARGVRGYGLYVCEIQDQADDHVQNIATLLESRAVEAFYPDLAARSVNKYGMSKGWRRNRLRTRSGLVVDAMGLDSAARGAKVDEQRPDFIVIDDVDGELDSPATTAKKIKTLTRKILPAGSSDLAVLAIQNLIHPDSIFSQVVDGRADFLVDRIVSGPIPAVSDMEYEQQEDGGRFVITAGRANWAGMDMVRCQEIIDDIGLTAFQSEYQHNVEPPPGGMFDHLKYQRCEWDDLPDLERIVVWCDPAVTDTDQSDSQGIQCDGLGVNGTVYRLWSWEGRTSPLDAITRALRKAVELGATEVGCETDQGGDTWQSVYREACMVINAEDKAMFEAQCDEDRAAAKAAGVRYVKPKFKPRRFPPFKSEKAGAGHGPKAHRAGKMLATYEKQGGFVHVLGTHHVLERALRRFPKTKPFDLTDAAYWSWYALSQPVPGPGSMTAPSGSRPEPTAGTPPTTPRRRATVAASSTASTPRRRAGTVRRGR